MPAGTGSEPADSGTAAPDRVGKASPSVSIFTLAPLCPNTCRCCRCKLYDVATDHEQRHCFQNESPSERPSGILSKQHRAKKRPIVGGVTFGGTLDSHENFFNWLLPVSSVRNLQRKFDFLVIQTTNLQSSQTCFPTLLMQRI